MAARSLRLTLRNVDGLVTAIALPVLLMLIFVWLFGGAISTGSSYVDYVVPGVLLVCIGFGAGTTAVSVAQDLGSGVIDRLRSLDVGGTAVVGGHVVSGLARSVVSTALLLVVAYALGFRPQAGLLDWAAAVGVVAAFVLALTWLAAALGTLARSAEAASGLAFFVSFLPYVSSAFVPVDTMPGWLQPVAQHRPTTPVLDTSRSLLMGHGAGSSWWLALAWSAGIVALSVVATAVIYRRRTR
jgi:ABC-2 type transport system permease protein